MGFSAVITSIGKKLFFLFLAWFIALITTYFLFDTMFYILLGIGIICLILLVVIIGAGIWFAPGILAAIGVDSATIGTIAAAHAASGTPPPGSPPPGPSPGTSLDFGALIKYGILIAAVAVIFYLIATNIGVTAMPTILTVILVGSLILGALRGVGICKVALLVFAGLVIEFLIFYGLSSYSPIFSGIIILFIWAFTLVAARVNGKRTTAVGLILILSTIAIAYTAFGTGAAESFISPNSKLQKAFDSQKDAWFGVYNAIITSIPGLIGSGREQVNRQINIATGDYETGVEAQSTKQLGVFLENLGMTETRVRKDGTVDFYARLRAESFSTSANAEPLLIDLRCYDDKTNKAGSLRPQDSFTVEEYESVDVDCLFDARELATGSNTLALEASFTFTTSAFLKSYFMDQETIRTYTRQREDPLDAFQITDKNPSAVYTAGPMRIGMNAGKQPLALVADRAEGPTLSLTLERAWLDGELLSLDELSITVPPGLRIESISGETPGNSCTTSTTQEQICTLGPEFISKIVTDLKKPFTTIRIFTTKQDANKILGGAPLAIRSFKTEIKYTYRIKKTQSVMITEAT